MFSLSPVAAFLPVRARFALIAASSFAADVHGLSTDAAPAWNCRTPASQRYIKCTRQSGSQRYNLRKVTSDLQENAIKPESMEKSKKINRPK